MRKGQVTLELTISLMIILILFLAMVQFSVWAMSHLVRRHNAYLKDFKTEYNKDRSFYQRTPKLNLVPDEIHLQQ